MEVNWGHWVGMSGEVPHSLIAYSLGPALGKIGRTRGLGPSRGRTKPDTDPPRPFGQNEANGRHQHHLLLEEGIRESCLEEGTWDLGFSECEMKEEGRAFQGGGIACAKPMRLQ